MDLKKHHLLALTLLPFVLASVARGQTELQDRAFQAAEKKVAKEVKENQEAKLLLQDAKKYEKGSLNRLPVTPPPPPKEKIKSATEMRKHHEDLSESEKKRRIQIDSSGYTIYNAEKKRVIFQRNVVVKHPSFDLNTDTLYVYLDEKSGEVKEAIAVGWVEIFRTSPSGKPQIAHARHAKYIASSGDVVLSIFPSVQEGNQLIEGTDETSKIYLPANGQYYTQGRTRVQMIHAEEEKKKPEENSPAAPTVSQTP